MDDTYMAEIEAEIEATLRPRHEDGIDQSRKNGGNRNIKVVKSEALSKPYEAPQRICKNNGSILFRNRV